MIRNSALATVLAGLAAGLALGTAGAALAQDRGDRMWDKLDKDGDGEITLSELNERHRGFFSDADADGNGAISREEMKAHHEKRRAEMRAKMFPDADGDGVVSKTEFDNAADERFDRLDENGDGVLSEDEMKAGRHGRGRRGH